MCLIALSLQVTKEYPLVLLANRDEFYDRPSAPLAEWSDQPGLYAGRDLRGGGTWMGLTRSGRFAAVTNYREPIRARFDSSRGHLVTDFLTTTISGPEYFADLQTRAAEYAGFNLLFGEFGKAAAPGEGGLHYLSNRGGAGRVLPPGIYGLSNDLLDTPWPKVRALKAALSSAMEAPGEDRLIGLLQDATRAADEELPETGIGLEWERKLSSRFIQSEEYGTRASNLVMLGRDGNATVIEHSYGPGGRFLGAVTERFALQYR